MRWRSSSTANLPARSALAAVTMSGAREAPNSLISRVVRGETRRLLIPAYITPSQLPPNSIGTAASPRMSSLTIASTRSSR